MLRDFVVNYRVVVDSLRQALSGRPLLSAEEWVKLQLVSGVEESSGLVRGYVLLSPLPPQPHGEEVLPGALVEGLIRDPAEAGAPYICS
jgi:hypothetical protein